MVKSFFNCIYKKKIATEVLDQCNQERKLDFNDVYVWQISWGQCFTSNQIHFAILNFCFVRHSHWSNLLLIKLVKLFVKEKQATSILLSRTHTYTHKITTNNHFAQYFWSIQISVWLTVLLLGTFCLFVCSLENWKIKYIIQLVIILFMLFLTRQQRIGRIWLKFFFFFFFVSLCECFNNIRFNIETLVATIRCRLFAHKQW